MSLKIDLKSALISVLDSEDAGRYIGHFYTFNDAVKVIAIIGAKAVVFIDEGMNKVKTCELMGLKERDLKLIAS